MSMDKKILRKEVLKKRDALDAKKRTEAENKIKDKIMIHQWYQSATDFLTFKGYGSEVSTDKILIQALQDGKHVYLPKVFGDDMEFLRIHSLDELEEGYKGILEPIGDEKYCYNPSQNDKVLMLMPGVAFDSMHNRIGYGKGFYDRYLQDKEELHTIGIGFKCQMVEKIPNEEQDIKVKELIIE